MPLHASPGEGSVAGIAFQVSSGMQHGDFFDLLAASLVMAADGRPARKRNGAASLDVWSLYTTAQAILGEFGWLFAGMQTQPHELACHKNTNELPAE